MFSRDYFTQRHGGESGGVYVYNIDENKWGKKRVQRSSDTLTIDGMLVYHAWVNLNMLWLLCGKKGEHCPLFYVNLVSLEWHQVNMRAYDEFELPKVSVDALYWMHHQQVYVFGHKSTELYRLDIDTEHLPDINTNTNIYGMWNRIHTTGESPTITRDSECVVIQNNTYVLDESTMRMHIYNNLTSNWTHIDSVVEKPSSEYYYALGALTTNTLLICGRKRFGNDPHDCWLYDIESNAWKKSNITIKLAGPPTLTSTGVQGELIVFSGYDKYMGILTIH